jgi:hypothetical protein
LGLQGEEKLLLEVPLEAAVAAVRLSFSWNDQATPARPPSPDPSSFPRGTSSARVQAPQSHKPALAVRSVPTGRYTLIILRKCARKRSYKRFPRALRAQGYGNQKGRVWLRVARNGERVSAWGEAPDEGVGIAPHYESEVDVVAPLADTLAGDCLQVTKWYM